VEIQVMISDGEYRLRRELLKYTLRTNRTGSPDEYLSSELGAAQPGVTLPVDMTAYETPLQVKRKAARADFLIGLYRLSPGLPHREPQAHRSQEEEAPPTRHGSAFNGMPSGEARLAGRREEKGKLLGAASDREISLLIRQIKEIAAAQRANPKPGRGRPIATDLYLRVLRELDLAGIPLRDWDQSKAHRLLIEELGMNESTAQSILRRLVDLRNNKMPRPREWRETF
jgi:hypothetical protein